MEIAVAVALCVVLCGVVLFLRSRNTQARAMTNVFKGEVSQSAHVETVKTVEK